MSAEGIRIRDGGALGDPETLAPIMAHWLADGAHGDWRRALDGETPPGVAPAWSHSDWREAWRIDTLADRPDAASRTRLNDAVDALAEGRAEVIVTGQQPGFLGGPLYTLFKIAACVRAAERRTAAGRPTIPLFWMGDDDDDLREAFDVRVWDPRRHALLRPVTPEAAPSSTVGALSSRLAGKGEAFWLGETAERGPLAMKLAEVWDTALAEDLTWGRLHRRVLAALFAERGLLVVSGDDAGLQDVAAPFHERLYARRAELAETARVAGQALEARGYTAQIGDASLQRPYGLSDGVFRLRLGEDDPFPEDPSRLRPGVLFRSPIQDWLFRPAGVVVGPGEYAYLRQLDPVYAALDLPRAPLLPRLFGALVREGSAGERDGDPEADRRRRVLADLDMGSERLLRESVAEAFGETSDRDEARIDAALSAWGRRTAALFNDLEARRVDREDPTDWERPGPGPQERILASYAAAALWGEDLLAAVFEAADRHFEAGEAGRWRRWHLVVPDPDLKGPRT